MSADTMMLPLTLTEAASQWNNCPPEHVPALFRQRRAAPGGALSRLEFWGVCKDPPRGCSWEDALELGIKFIKVF